MPTTPRLPPCLPPLCPPPPCNYLCRHTDYHGWLAAKKAAWRRSREARKRKQVEAAAGGDGRGVRQRREQGAGAADVTGLFQRAAEEATAAHWQIVSIAPTPEPGVWVEGLWVCGCA